MPLPVPVPRQSGQRLLPLQTGHVSPVEYLPLPPQALHLFDPPHIPHFAMSDPAGSYAQRAPRPLVSERYHPGMAMTLRLTGDESAALRRQAEREGRSMQDVARAAVRDYIERASRRELLERVLDEDLPRYAEALRRLGE